MRQAIRWGIFAGALATALPSAGLADGGPAAREAERRFEEGIARVKAGNVDGARVSFTQAYAVLRRPYILWNLALAEEKTGRALDALGHFKDFVRGQKDGDERGNAQRHIAELMAETGHFVVVAPTGSQVFVDGVSEGTLPLTDSVDVVPGRHHVEARTPQGERDADADVMAGQVVRVNLLPPMESTPTVPPNSPPPAVAADTAAPTGRVPPPIDAPLVHPWDDGTTARESSTRRMIVVVLVGATAAVSIATGAYFAFQSGNEASTATGFRTLHPSDYCFQMTSANGSVCTQWNDAVQAQGRDATLSAVLYVTGAVLAAGAVATWLLWPKVAGSPWALLTPAVGPGAAALSAVGRF